MVRKLRLILPLLFVFVFAFTMVIAIYSTAMADKPCSHLDPRPGCCILAIHCWPGTEYTTWVCGYGVWDGNQCVKTASMDCPQPENCPPIP